jgi:cytidine deaminase
MTARARGSAKNGSLRSRVRTPARGVERARVKAAKVDFAALRAAAEAVLANAHAPYSRLQVGAAVLDRSGRVFAGVNVENASFGLTVCAERNALGSAVAAGARGLHAVVVVSSARHAITPCGACRQVLLELAPEAELRCYGRDGGELRVRVRELMPHAFAAGDVPVTARRSAPRSSS